VIFPNDALGGFLSQTFQTVVGGYCTVGFDAAYVYTADNPLIGAMAEASDGTVLSNNVYTPLFWEWTNFQLSFLATTPTTTLIFSDASPDTEGADLGLDGVTLVAEPPGWPYIIISPTNQTNGAGTQVTFKATAGGYPSTVQWYLGTNAVAEGTNTKLMEIASEATAGSYTAVFSNSAGTNGTMPAVLTVLLVLTSPVSQTVSSGTQVTLTSSANIIGATNQWYFGPYPIPGAISPSLTFTANNQTAGNYSVQYGADNVLATSSTALLTVLNIPFTNGSFEVLARGQSIAPGNNEAGEVGDEWLTGWTFGTTNNEIFVFNGSFLGLEAADGEQWVVFDSQNSPPPGVLSQTFSTTLGTTYLVTFEAMAVYYENAPPKNLAATALASDGTLLAENDVEPPADWSTNQMTFTAQTVNTTLSFTDDSFPNFGPSVALDAVTVAAIAQGGVPFSPTVLTTQGFQPADGTFVVQLAGQAGLSYIMQTSTNLADWIPVSTNALAGPPVNITNALLPGAAAQFWRAVPML